jgi:AcrR family transcriptional regulator
MSTYLTTHDRILDGALRAVYSQGLARLAMRDVGTYAGVARGTVYRHFPTRGSLLEELGRREAQRFMDRWRASLVAAPQGADRILAALEYPARFSREHPVLRKLVETDPDYVLRYVRDLYPVIRDTMQQLLGPHFADHPLVHNGVLRVDDLVDWSMRIMVSTFLFPPEDPEALVGALATLIKIVRGATLPS